MAVDMHERPGNEAIMIISKAVNATLLIALILDIGLDNLLLLESP